MQKIKKFSHGERQQKFCNKCDCLTEHKHRLDPKTGWSKGWQCLPCAIKSLNPHVKTMDEWAEKFKT